MRLMVTKMLNNSEVAKHFDNMIFFSFPSVTVIENYKEHCLAGLCDNWLKLL